MFLYCSLLCCLHDDVIIYYIYSRFSAGLCTVYAVCTLVHTCAVQLQTGICRRWIDGFRLMYSSSQAYVFVLNCMDMCTYHTVTLVFSGFGWSVCILWGHHGWCPQIHRGQQNWGSALMLLMTFVV